MVSTIGISAYMIRALNLGRGAKIILALGVESRFCLYTSHQTWLYLSSDADERQELFLSRRTSIRTFSAFVRAAEKRINRRKKRLREVDTRTMVPVTKNNTVRPDTVSIVRCSWDIVGPSDWGSSPCKLCATHL